MAVFQFNNRSIPYRIVLAPFHFDLVLLQGSRAGAEIWEPILADFAGRDYGGGRVLVCGVPVIEPAELVRLLEALALVAVRVVALEDAVAAVNEAQKLQPRLFERTLFFADGASADLVQAVRELCQF